MVKKTKKNQAGLLALVAAVGAAIGGLLGILFAPQSGKKTRQEIGDFFQKIEKEVKEEAQKAGRLTEKKYRQIVNQVSQRYLEAKKIGIKKAEEIKKKLYQEYSSLKGQRKSQKGGRQ